MERPCGTVVIQAPCVSCAHLESFALDFSIVTLLLLHRSNASRETKTDAFCTWFFFDGKKREIGKNMAYSIIFYDFCFRRNKILRPPARCARGRGIFTLLGRFYARPSPTPSRTAGKVVFLCLLRRCSLFWLGFAGVAWGKKRQETATVKSEPNCDHVFQDTHDRSRIL